MDSGGSQESTSDRQQKSGSSQQESSPQLVVENIVGHQRKGKAQAIYKTFRTFKNRHFFLNWWKQSGQEYNWQINSRHPHSKGMVEYYYCKVGLLKKFLFKIFLNSLIKYLHFDQKY